MLLKVEDLTHIYMPDTTFSKTAIENVSFSVEKGEFIGLIGHSGSGKSTLIQHLNGLLTPTKGKIFYNGEDIWSDKEKIRRIRFEIGLVFQYPEAQLFEETVYQDIAFGPKNMELSEAEIKQRVYDACDIVGIREEMLEKSPFELSGGQKRRVAIAGVLAMKPSIIILDEPTAGLDPKGRNSILNRIKQLHESWGITVILVSHSMEDIANNASRIIVMDHGKIVMDGGTETVFSRVDELEKIGLSVPQVTKVFFELKKAGYPVNTNILTTEEGRDEILRVLKKRGNAKC